MFCKYKNLKLKSKVPFLFYSNLKILFYLNILKRTENTIKFRNEE